ncbi:hypothetical protein D5F01_LYC00816 [Larimichthys crocea]|uniref:Ig-like domain-containing protein n=1 Tax=Larimichthys crocea TaxID=215358 RepID=A0A6G0JA68_LARCR|nr:hypothetical protein D5F01_LYC00816 [Larimichthys crocea]
MRFTAMHILLWVLTALTLTTQELVTTSVSPNITAERGKQVTLDCNVSSSLNGLSVIRMQWWYGTSLLCSVDSDGNITPHRESAPSLFHCEYKHGQLSLIFERIVPLVCGKYTCKLRSDRGMANAATWVDLQECYGNVEDASSGDKHTCTFHHVYPDGDVHWFHGSHNLSDLAKHTTTKQVDNEGWLTVRSEMLMKHSDKPYNCSLMNTKSGRYIGSTLIQISRMLYTIQSEMELNHRDMCGHFCVFQSYLLSQ